MVSSAVQLLVGPFNNTGWFRCPLQLICFIFKRAEGVQSIISFVENFNTNGEKARSAPWDTDLYRSYQAANPNARMFPVDYYSDGATLRKSGQTFLDFYSQTLKNFQRTGSMLE